MFNQNRTILIDIFKLISKESFIKIGNKKFAASIIFSLLLFFSSISFSQTEEWVTRYNGGGNGDDGTSKILADASGNIYVGGWATVKKNNVDFALIKYNSNGVQQWIKTYDGTGRGGDYIKEMAADNNGNIIVAGASMNSKNRDIVTIKYNSAGSQLWTQRYNGPGNGDDYPYAIAVDQQGNTYVAGSSLGKGTNRDWVLLKYSPAGSLLWVQRYNGTANGDDFAVSLAIDSQGDVFAAGSSLEINTGSDITIIRYNSNGVLQWKQNFDGPMSSVDGASIIKIDSEGNLIVAGSSVVNNDDMWTDFVVIKYSPAGVQQWVSFYDGPANSDDIIVDAALDSDDNIYVTGHTVSNETWYDITTIKLSPEGVQQWIRSYETGGRDLPSAIVIDNQNNVYVSGFNWGQGEDYALIKYDSNGDEKWVQTYNGTGGGNDRANCLALDPQGNPVVSGTSFGVKSNDIATIKYSSGNYKIGTGDETSSLLKWELQQNYPNPFNPSTKISWQSQFGSWQTLKVFDVLGREVATLVDEYRDAGFYEVDFNAADLPSGVYMYKLQAGDYVQTKKMILLK